MRQLRQATLISGFIVAELSGQTALTWQQVRDRFERANPNLRAAQLSIDESRAAEITAYLRPNPNFNLTLDGTQIAPRLGIYRPFSGTSTQPAISYLHEREHKRELRLETAKEATGIAASAYLDQERGLLFNLRTAFVFALQAKAFLENARTNLDYWDHELAIDKIRLDSGDIAQIDYDRLELERVQFESDFETAKVNLRTAKIQLLQLMNDRTPIDQFDIDGPYGFTALTTPVNEFRSIALATRPDLRAALQSVDLAKSTHKLAVSNGSTDPTYSVWITNNSSNNNPYGQQTIGASVNIPLRIFDRNQGEKARTQLDIPRTERLADAAEAQVFSDVDSAYAAIESLLNQLTPYRDKYLKKAADIRDRVEFAYQNGGASLLDYLDAEKAYRDTRLAYLNLIGAYLGATAQMNQALGREIL